MSPRCSIPLEHRNIASSATPRYSPDGYVIAATVGVGKSALFQTVQMILNNSDIASSNTGIDYCHAPDRQF